VLNRKLERRFSIRSAVFSVTVIAFALFLVLLSYPAPKFDQNNLLVLTYGDDLKTDTLPKVSFSISENIFNEVPPKSFSGNQAFYQIPDRQPPKGLKILGSTETPHLITLSAIRPIDLLGIVRPIFNLQTKDLRTDPTLELGLEFENALSNGRKNIQTNYQLWVRRIKISIFISALLISFFSLFFFERFFGQYFDSSVENKITRWSTIKSKSKTIVPAVLTPLALLFITGPMMIYYGNIIEFSVPYSAILPRFLGATFAFLIFISIGIIVFRPSISERLTAAFMTLGILMWIQGNLITRNYGVIDGRGMDFNTYSSAGILETLAWAVTIVIAVYFGRNIKRYSPAVCAIILAMQGAAILSKAAIAPDISDKFPTPINQSIFEFSKKRNIVLIILDTFQSDVFFEITRENPEWKTRLKDFTYFRDMTSGYQNTGGALPLIMTGEYFDNNVRFEDFVKEKSLTVGFPHLLTKNGYLVDLVTSKFFTYCSPEVTRNCYEPNYFEADDINPLRRFFYLTDLSMFRHGFHHAKKLVYGNRQWFLRRILFQNYKPPVDPDATLTSMFSDNMYTETDKLVMKLIHLAAPHPPIRIDENLNAFNGQYNRTNFKRQARGALRYAEILLDGMKRIGVYDNSTIMIMADHGADVPVSFDGTNFKDAGPFKTWKPSRNAHEIKRRGMALLLIKKKSETHDSMKISDSQISQADIAPTVLAEAGIKSPSGARSIFDIPESETRMRRYLFYDWYQRIDTTSGYMADMDEYIIEGFSWQNQSWKPTGRIFKKPDDGIAHTE